MLETNRFTHQGPFGLRSPAGVPFCVLGSGTLVHRPWPGSPNTDHGRGPEHRIGAGTLRLRHRAGVWNWKTPSSTSQQHAVPPTNPSGAPRTPTGASGGHPSPSGASTALKTLYGAPTGLLADLSAITHHSTTQPLHPTTKSTVCYLAYRANWKFSSDSL